MLRRFSITMHTREINSKEQLIAADNHCAKNSYSDERFANNGSIPLRGS